MFKTSFSSWFKKPTPAPPSENVIDAGANRFVAPSTKNKHQLVHITMDDGDLDSFVGIDYKQLTYAEAAALSPKLRQQLTTNDKKSVPQKIRAPKTKSEEPIEELHYENFKSGDSYERSKTYKGKQREQILQKRAEKEKKRKERKARS